MCSLKYSGTWYLRFVRMSSRQFRTEHYSLITCNVLAATACVLVDMVSGFEKFLSYLDRCIELQPLLVGRQADAIDIVRSDPVDNRVDRGLSRGEDLVNLLSRVESAIIRGAVC